jgi:hypothetical protein
MEPDRPGDDTFAAENQRLGRAQYEGEELGEHATALVELARRSFGEMSERQRLAGLQGLRTRLCDGQRASRMRWTALALSGAGAGIVLLVAVAARRHDHGVPMTLRVEGAELRTDGSVEAAGSLRPVLRFSDGSQVALDEGARVHVHSLDEQGARVTLDEGRAHVYVVHGHDTHWAFEAGPFVVSVTGTAFGLSWSESGRRLDVQLENGAVTVMGPESDVPLAMHAGQWLTVRGSEVLIRPFSSGDASEVTMKASEGDLGSDAGKASASVDTRGSGSRGRAVESDGPKRPWASDLASGQFDAIVDEALSLGLQRVFTKSSSNDLAALADAARYTRREDIARGALLAQRQRFAGSEHGQVAAFHLGRMAESDHDARSALSWFGTYIAEAPNGTYASEALGRRMTLVQADQGNQAARPLAVAYLRRFPDGIYAETARALTAAP